MIRSWTPSERLTSILYGAAAGVGVASIIPMYEFHPARMMLMGVLILLAMATEGIRAWNTDRTDDDVDT